MTRRQAELLLAAVILARSTGYLFTKIGLNSLSTFNIIALRSLFAFVLLAAVFRKRLKGVELKTVFRGAALGGMFFLVMTAELTGLKTTDTSTVSFLENTAIIFVPIFEAVLLRKMPKGISIISALAAILGVGLLTLKNGALSVTRGEWFCVLAAALYAAAIIMTDRFSHKDNGFAIGLLQVGFIGFFALIASFIWESPRLPQSPTEWGVILALALVCSAFGFTFQPVAQSKTSAERAGLFCALNPAFASLLGVVFLSEPVTVQGLAGAALILLSLFIPHIIKKEKSDVK